MKSLRTLFLATACVLASASALAQWGWTGPDGRKVYSDRPPPASVSDKSVFRRPGGSAPVASTSASPMSGTASAASAPLPAAAPATSDAALEAKKKQADTAEAERKKVEEQKNVARRAENCRRAQEALATLSNGRPIIQNNRGGERVFMDEKARAAEVKRAQEAIQSQCGPQAAPANAS